MKATEFFRALDDSDLDVYETRYLLRVWRRGTCWEKLTSIAESTGMSIGKASQVRRGLIDKGWLTEVITDGRVAYQVSLPPVVEFHEVKEDVAEFHSVKPEFHEVKPEFHEVSALPLIDQNEDHTIKAQSPPPPSSATPAPLIALREHFSHKTTIQPNERTGTYEQDWVEPLRHILTLSGNDLETARKMVDECLDRAWTPKRDGGTYTVRAPKSLHTFAVNLAAERAAHTTTADDDALWRRAMAAIAGGKTDDNRLLAALRSIGVERIRYARETDAPELKRRLSHAYRNVATA